MAPFSYKILSHFFHFTKHHELLIYRLTAVYKDPNRHRTQTLILGFWISETQNEQKKKKKEGKCYEFEIRNQPLYEAV